LNIFLLAETFQSIEKVERILSAREVTSLGNFFFANGTVTRENFGIFYNYFGKVLVHLKTDQFALIFFKLGYLKKKRK
jgi:hypothetical protein